MQVRQKCREGEGHEAGTAVLCTPKKVVPIKFISANREKEREGWSVACLPAPVGAQFATQR